MGSDRRSAESLTVELNAVAEALGDANRRLGSLLAEASRAHHHGDDGGDDDVTAAIIEAERTVGYAERAIRRAARLAGR